MHTIGNYVFDSRRLILYSIDYSDAQRALIYDHFQSDDCFDKLYSVLKSWQNRSSMKRPLININDFSCGALSPLCDCPWLMPDGSIVTCIETDQHKTEIGRVEGNNVIWYETCNDPLLNMYVRKFRECSECIAYRFCKGGCPIRHLRNEHINTSMSDWECDMIQEHISNLINSTIKGDKHTGWKIETVGIEGTMLEVLQLVKTGG